MDGRNGRDGRDGYDGCDAEGEGLDGMIRVRRVRRRARPQATLATGHKPLGLVTLACLLACLLACPLAHAHAHVHSAPVWSAYGPLPAVFQLCSSCVSPVALDSGLTGSSIH
jgi:hypothetical protein